MTSKAHGDDRPSPGAALNVYTLACGMPLVVEENRGVGSAALTWLLPVGSGADREDRQGLSTMLSELIFRGAGTLNSRQQADALDRLGLSRGADVGAAHLRLSATMLSAKVIDALPLLADMVLRPRFEPDAIEPVRDLSLQALQGLKDQPQERGGIMLTERHNHPPLNRSGLGTESGLESITREELASHWAARARPGGSILAICGNVNGSDIARRLDEVLRGWGGEAPKVECTASPTRGTYHHEEEQASQVHIYLAHEAPRESDPDAVLERIGNAVLSGGSSSRLFTEVRERRALCYSVHAWYAADKLWGRVTGYVGTTPDKAQMSLDVMMAELRRMGTRAGAVTPEEFQRAVVGYKSKLVFAGESTGARAAAIASDLHRLGRPRTLSELAAAIDRVTLDELNAYFARRTMGAVTIVTLGPGALKRPE
ncbi:MAG: M16 family metallopeptidase [Phycisphaerales bacterium]